MVMGKDARSSLSASLIMRWMGNWVAEEFRRQLRQLVYRVGLGRIRHGEALPDDLYHHRRIYLFSSHRRMPAGHRSGAHPVPENRPGGRTGIFRAAGGPAGERSVIIHQQIIWGCRMKAAPNVFIIFRFSYKSASYSNVLNTKTGSENQLSWRFLRSFDFFLPAVRSGSSPLTFAYTFEKVNQFR